MNQRSEDSRPPTRTTPGLAAALVAPGSAPRDPEALARGRDALEAALERRGGCLVGERRAYAPHGYLAGTDEERLDELNTLLRTPNVEALFCIRGGYGCLRLLPHLDYEAARAHPKLLVGYSDVTALHLALYARAEWRGLSGPMVAVEWPAIDSETERLFWPFLDREPPHALESPDGHALVPERAGTAEGVLLGGNLAVLTRLVGTPYLPDLDGAILFLEDVDEAPYRIDGMLAHLRLAGLLERLGGLVFGQFTGWDEETSGPTLPLDEVLNDYARYVDGPVATGLAYGHVPRKSTLPVGVRARLDVTGDLATLDVLEPVV